MCPHRLFLWIKSIVAGKRGICKGGRMWYNAKKEGWGVKYSHVIDTLRQFCLDMSGVYQEEYERQGGLGFCRYLVMDELHDKLCTLVDREFPDFEACLAAVKELLPGYRNPTLQKPSPVAAYFIREAETAFRERLESIRPDCPAPEIPYLRLLTGEEAERIAARFRETWGYVPRNYWYPMNGEEIREDRLYISGDYVESYWDELEKLLGLPERHIFYFLIARGDLPNFSEKRREKLT